MTDNQYLFLDVFSRDVGIPKENLVAAFEVEKEFHTKILSEPDPQARKALYEKVYNTVHRIYAKDRPATGGLNSKEMIVRLFSQELSGKAILDIGCGNGDFLRSVARQLPYERLVGIDISAAVLARDERNLHFINSDIINFALSERFDVAFSDNVFEHIAPQDIDIHIDAVRKALRPGGRFILITPNRLFGPSDVTRIVDYTYSNKVAACGTHVNESTYAEVLALLKRHGFTKFNTVLPVPRLKFYVPWMRFDASLMSKGENNQFLMHLLYAMRFRGRCFVRLDILLVCSA